MSAMSIEEAAAVLEDRNLIAVGARGDEERRRRHGTRTTFVRVFEVHADAVPSSIPAGVDAGELRITGRPSSADAAVAAVETALTAAAAATAPATARTAPPIPVTGFSLADLFELGGASVPGFGRLAARLAASGLHVIAEAPIDAVPDPVGVVQAAREAGLAVPRLTVREATDARRLPLVAIARDIQDRVGGVRAFAPLPRVGSVAQPSTGYDDVRLIAAARLVAGNIESIQVDWALYGPKLAQVALTMGADDVDAVSPLAGGLGRRRSPLEEIRGNIRAAGLEPVERDGWFAARAESD